MRRKQTRALTRMISIMLVLSLLALAFLLGVVVKTSLEAQYNGVDRIDPIYVCGCGGVYVDCCCPTEVACHTATPTPVEQATPTAGPEVSRTVRPSETRARPTPTPTATRVLRTSVATVTDAPPTATPTIQHTRTAVPTIEPVFCHCEQGEGKGARDRKNCHPAKYTHGHSQHEWDYWSTDGTCDGWNH